MNENESVVDRLNKFRKLQGYNSSEFERLCDLSNGYLRLIKTPGADKLEHILNVFPELNRKWVMDGSGPMLNEEDRTADEEAASTTNSLIQEVNSLTQENKFLRQLADEKERYIELLKDKLGMK